jgi:hemerythrin-like domain-containing protein
MLQAIAEGKSATLEEKVVAHFSLLYERHITLENAQLLPLAAQLLSSEQLSALGKKMAGRRGVAHSSP